MRLKLETAAQTRTIFTLRICSANILRKFQARTKTDTFYGVCFDYAQAAYNEIKKNRSWFIKNGMADNQWYIAANSKDNSCIILYDPVSPEKSDFSMNGVPVKEKARRYFPAHVDSRGIPAKNHAWLWIQRNDGTWFWIDPTWTDNLGYICYGVVQNGREVYLPPDSSLCITSFRRKKLPRQLLLLKSTRRRFLRRTRPGRIRLPHILLTGAWAGFLMFLLAMRTLTKLFCLWEFSCLLSLTEAILKKASTVQEKAGFSGFRQHWRLQSFIL